MGNDTTPGGELVETLNERASLVATLSNPNISLARAAGTYILFKRRRLTASSERGYGSILNEFAAVRGELVKS